jgi:hypothetical protein
MVGVWEGIAQATRNRSWTWIIRIHPSARAWIELA